ncbi:hypothetical protein ACQJBY_015560 [Aegilops geniculata]
MPLPYLSLVASPTSPLKYNLPLLSALWYGSKVRINNWIVVMYKFVSVPGKCGSQWICSVAMCLLDQADGSILKIYLSFFYLQDWFFGWRFGRSEHLTYNLG